MANFFNSSIGKKFLVSITGLFLIAFLAVHLIVNSMILFDNSGELFNRAAHFMGTHPIIKIVEPLLAVGFILHIIYAVVVTIQNWIARPISYEKRKSAHSSTWSSRNMIWLGVVVLVFLVIHIAQFFWKMKVTGDPLLEGAVYDGEHMENAYQLVTTFFITWWWVVIFYVVGAVALGFHLAHAFWSAFQTLGLSNTKWRSILNVIGLVYTLIISAGFAIIPLWVKIASM